MSDLTDHMAWQAARITELETERSPAIARTALNDNRRLRAQIAAALALHVRHEWEAGDPQCDKCVESWPCATVVILASPVTYPEPEPRSNDA